MRHRSPQAVILPPAKKMTSAEQRASVSNLCVQRQRRARYLNGLVGHVDALWQRVEALVATKRQTDVDDAPSGGV